MITLLVLGRIRSFVWYSSNSIIARILSLFRHSPGFDHSSGTRQHSITLSVLDRILSFFRYSPGFDHFFWYLPRFDHFSGTCLDSITFWVLARIQSLFRYSLEFDHFFGTRQDSITFRYSPRFFYYLSRFDHFF